MAEQVASLDGARVLVIANEQVAERMAGPAIRSKNLAEQLAARGAQVTLAVPGPELPDLPGIETAAFGMPSRRTIAPLARDADVIVTQPQRVDVAWALRSTGRPVIYDLYVPSFLERIASLVDEDMPTPQRARLLERDRREYAAAIELGDAFLCASERQKDHWLGALGQAGRLDLGLIERDPRGDQLVGIVPFGVDEAPAPEQPAAGTGPIRGPLVPPDSVVLLWTGGIWNWFDPVTIVEGLAAARERDPRIRLVVMGVRHPEGRWEEHDAVGALRRRADELGLIADGSVVFNEEWVPHAERGAWLTEADIGVSAHRDTLETRLSFRTRLLDHLWAGLPTISTSGGDLVDAMVTHGAALHVADGDVTAWSRAIEGLAGAGTEREAMSQRALELGEHYRWSRVVEPLVSIIANLTAPQAPDAAPPDSQRLPYRARRMDAVSYAALLVRVRTESKGIRSLGSAFRGARGR